MCVGLEMIAPRISLSCRGSWWEVECHENRSDSWWRSRRVPSTPLQESTKCRRIYTNRWKTININCAVRDTPFYQLHLSSGRLVDVQLLLLLIIINIPSSLYPKLFYNLKQHTRHKILMNQTRAVGLKISAVLTWTCLVIFGLCTWTCLCFGHWCC